MQFYILIYSRIVDCYIQRSNAESVCEEWKFHLKLAFSAKIIPTLLKWLAPVSSGVFRLRIGKLKPGLMPGTAVCQIQRYEYTNTNPQIQMHKYKYTNTISQIQLHKCKNTKIRNTKKYKYKNTIIKIQLLKYANTRIQIWNWKI